MQNFPNINQIISKLNNTQCPNISNNKQKVGKEYTSKSKQIKKFPNNNAEKILKFYIICKSTHGVIVAISQDQEGRFGTCSSLYTLQVRMIGHMLAQAGQTSTMAEAEDSAQSVLGRIMRLGT